MDVYMYVCGSWRCVPVRVSCRFNSPEGPGWAAGGLLPEPQGTLPALPPDVYSLGASPVSLPWC